MDRYTTQYTQALLAETARLQSLLTRTDAMRQARLVDSGLADSVTDALIVCATVLEACAIAIDPEGRDAANDGAPTARRGDRLARAPRA